VGRVPCAGWLLMPLYIRPIMNSSVEEIFAFKTCCGMRVFDQNLEIQITNQKDYPSMSKATLIFSIVQDYTAWRP